MGRRFKKKHELIPGPGEYSEKGNVADGAQMCTNYHSTITKNLGTTEKRTDWDGNPRFRTPGPGSYRPPSDFGYLDRKMQQRDANMSIFSGTAEEQMFPNKLKFGSQISATQQTISMQSERRKHVRKHELLSLPS